MKQILHFFTITLLCLFVSCVPEIDQEQIEEVKENEPIDINTEENKSCSHLLDGESESRQVYKFNQVNLPETCSANVETQTRTCLNGSLSEWSGSYTHLNCTEIQSPSATSTACPGGIKDGSYQTRIRYKTSSTTTPNSCENQKQVQSRQCNNGVFSKWSGGSEYIYTSCNSATYKSCGNLSHGQTISKRVYKSDQVVWPSSCVFGTKYRSCHNGTLSDWWGSSYQYSSCVVAPLICPENYSIVNGACKGNDEQEQDSNSSLEMGAIIPINISARNGYDSRDTNSVRHVYNGNGLSRPIKNGDSENYIENTLHAGDPSTINTYTFFNRIGVGGQYNSLSERVIVKVDLGNNYLLRRLYLWRMNHIFSIRHFQIYVGNNVGIINWTDFDRARQTGLIKQVTEITGLNKLTDSVKGYSFFSFDATPPNGEKTKQLPKKIEFSKEYAGRYVYIIQMGVKMNFTIGELIGFGKLVN